MVACMAKVKVGDKVLVRRSEVLDAPGIVCRVWSDEEIDAWVFPPDYEACQRVANVPMVAREPSEFEGPSVAWPIR